MLISLIHILQVLLKVQFFQLWIFWKQTDTKTNTFLCPLEVGDNTEQYSPHFQGRKDFSAAMEIQHMLVQG